MNNAFWSYILTIVGLTGFVFVGKKVWWAWYINIGCQVLWFAYAIVTAQYGFIIAALAYTVVFWKNALEWTNEHQAKLQARREAEAWYNAIPVENPIISAESMARAWQNVLDELNDQEKLKANALPEMGKELVADAVKAMRNFKGTAPIPKGALCEFGGPETSACWNIGACGCKVVRTEFLPEGLTGEWRIDYFSSARYESEFGDMILEKLRRRGVAAGVVLNISLEERMDGRWLSWWPDAK